MPRTDPNLYSENNSIIDFGISLSPQFPYFQFQILTHCVVALWARCETWGNSTRDVICQFIIFPFIISLTKFRRGLIFDDSWRDVMCRYLQGLGFEDVSVDDFTPAPDQGGEQCAMSRSPANTLSSYLDFYNWLGLFGFQKHSDKTWSHREMHGTTFDVLIFIWQLKVWASKRVQERRKWFGTARDTIMFCESVFEILKVQVHYRSPSRMIMCSRTV